MAVALTFANRIDLERLKAVLLQNLVSRYPATAHVPRFATGSIASRKQSATLLRRAAQHSLFLPRIEGLKPVIFLGCLAPR